MADEKRKQLSKKEQDLIAEAYSEYRNHLMDYVEQFDFSPDVAENLVQDAFLAVVESPEKFLRCENRIGWLTSILRNCMGHLKREIQYMLQLQEKLERQFSESQESEFSLETLYSGSVSKADLELLVLYYVEKRPCEELCAKYGIGESACRKRVQRAKERFCKRMEEDEK